MKTTENSLLLKANQNQTTLTPSENQVGVKSARPMKSMVRVKSIRPQRVELKGGIKAGMRRRVVKL